MSTDLDLSRLDRMIRFSLDHPLLILALAGIVLVLGPLWVAGLPVDIFPDLQAPTVTVITEAPGMAPEEVELLVSLPLESALNGAPGLRRLRSVSADGITVLWVEFDWGEDVYRARQVVAERLQRVELPATVERPELGPISSIMGEITFIALTSETVSPLELRRLAETVVRRNLLALSGVSQVVPIGGEVGQFQVELDPKALAQHRVALEEVLAILASASQNPAAGFHVDSGQEYLVRGLGRVRSPEELAAAVVRVEGGVPLVVADLGTVRIGAEPARGTASYKTRPAVVLSIQKQPGANTLELTRRIDALLARLAASLPAGVVLEKENFRQADFIAVAIRNVSLALRDGAVLVVVILFLFLGNLRTTLISALAIPLSLIAGVAVVTLLGGTLNTMTLGGLTIAIGALVDDAIIDVENVFRRLREQHGRPEGMRRPPLMVVFRASSEVRKAIFFATLIIVLVFLPVFFLPGIEGRLLRPLGLAYIASLTASLLVSLTVTPVLCYLLLRDGRLLERRESLLMRALHAVYRPSLELALRHRTAVIAAGVLLVAAALAVIPGLGRSFLPPFKVAHYQHLMREEGLTLAEAVRRGSEERLAPILMTALTAGLALVPLILAGGEPGNEIQSPMARVILGRTRGIEPQFLGQPVLSPGALDSPVWLREYPASVQWAVEGFSG